MSGAVYDVVVVGAGVEGSACAYTMAKKGMKVLLLEQFPLPHSRGSSHGHSRIIRYAYEEDFYTRMMLEAFPLWHTLAKETQTQVFKRCGVLNVGPVGGNFLGSISRAMGRHSMKQEGLTPQQLAHRYPTLSFSPGIGGLLDPEGGVLLADRCLNAFLTMFRRLGGEVHDGEPVISITPGQPLVTVTTVKGQYSASSVVVATGPWTAKIMKPLGLHLPFTATRVTVMYWREKQEGSHAISCFPCLIDGREEEEGGHIYALPSDEYPGYVKVCLHTGPAVDPDFRDEMDEEQLRQVRQKVTDYVQQHMPGLHPTPGIVETCLYTNTPDNNALIDCHPQHKNIVIAAGFSGSGFKLAPVVGQMVWELVSGKPPSHDLTPFSVSRFTCTPSAKL